MLHRYPSIAIIALFSSWASCAMADVPIGCDAATTTSPSTSPAALVSLQPNLSVFKAQLLVYRCTSYDNEIELIVREAQAWLKQRASQVTSPTIVLDVDETSLSNWSRMYYKDGYPYLPHDACDLTKLIEACGDVDWQWSAKAPAIQPVLDLYRLAQCIEVAGPCTKVEVFFVTGRREGDKFCPKPICPDNDKSINPANWKTPTEWTLENLQKAGFSGATLDHLRMRPKTSSGQVSDYKTEQRIAIEALGKTIIANVGDQESDLVGKHADRTFKVPNPFYLIP